MKEQISAHNIACDLSMTVDVGFCQIGKGHSLRRVIQRRYAPAIRFGRLVDDMMIFEAR